MNTHKKQLKSSKTDTGTGKFYVKFVEPKSLFQFANVFETN